MIYLIKISEGYKIAEGKCNTNTVWYDVFGSNRHYFYTYIEDGEKKEFSTFDIVDKTTSKSIDFAKKKWAEYLI